MTMKILGFLHEYNQCVMLLSLGAVALTVGAVLHGTILNYIIFIGHYRGQPIQQPIKMT